eukprot:893024-Pleurochrysis_carterae.AAC.1
MTFVMRDTIGQTRLVSRASGFGVAGARSVSSLTLGCAGVSGARVIGGARAATLRVDSHDDRASESGSGESDDSSESGCEGGGSGK